MPGHNASVDVLLVIEKVPAPASHYNSCVFFNRTERKKNGPYKENNIAYEQKIPNHMLPFSVLVAFFFGLFLGRVPDQSNFDKLIGTDLLLPIVITMFIVKYVAGDWDTGYQWSLLDLLFWIVIACVASAGVIIGKRG